MFRRFLFCLLAAGVPVWGSIPLNDPRLLIEQLAAGNYHQKCELSVLDLFQLDPDFFKGLSQEAISIFSTFGMSTKKLSLLNNTGKFYDTSSDHDRSLIGKHFFHSRTYPYLARLISLFPHAINFRMMRMTPLSQLYQHDENICLRHRITGDPCFRVRFHLPIKTSSESLMFMEGEFFHFEEGHIYFFHNGRTHDAMNMHPKEERIHLVWDMLLTEDTFHRMFERSIQMPELHKIDNPWMDPISLGEIDPNFIKRPRTFLYDEALRATLCPIQ